MIFFRIIVTIMRVNSFCCRSYSIINLLISCIIYRWLNKIKLAISFFHFPYLTHDSNDYRTMSKIGLLEILNFPFRLKILQLNRKSILCCKICFSSHYQKS